MNSVNGPSVLNRNQPFGRIIHLSTSTSAPSTSRPPSRIYATLLRDACYIVSGTCRINASEYVLSHL